MGEGTRKQSLAKINFCGIMRGERSLTVGPGRDCLRGPFSGKLNRFRTATDDSEYRPDIRRSSTTTKRMLLVLLPLKEYVIRLAELRSIADIVLVFLVVYGVLKLLRGTRAAPMAAAIGAFALLYWLALNQRLMTLEFVLRGALLYIGVAIIVLFQSEIRQALITFGNRFRVPFVRRQRGQFGGSIYDNIVLAAMTLASTKTGALIVIGRKLGLRGIIEAGVRLDAQP